MQFGACCGTVDVEICMASHENVLNKNKWRYPGNATIKKQSLTEALKEDEMKDIDKTFQK